MGSIDERVLAFTAGKDTVLDLALAEADCIGTAAHVTMLAKVRVNPPLFTPRQRDRVVAELVAILRRARAGTFRIETQDQDVHLAVERLLTAALGDLGRKVHTARSRNDQVATDLRIFARGELLAALREALALADVLLRMARRHRLTPMVGRTHLQPAMPSSVGLWASAYAESLLDDVALLWAAYELNNRSPLGSAASYGVSLAIDRRLTARLLGFERPIRNVLCAGNARGKCESAVLSALGQVMMTLSRLSEDVVLYCMPEFGYFSLPKQFGTGSSIMPQKSNPDVFELVRAKARRVLAHQAAVCGIVAGMPGGYNRDLQETKEPFLDGLATTRACLRVLTPVMDGLQVNRAALLRGFSPAVFATDMALAEVVRGTPFRTAYDRVKERLATLPQMDAGRAVRERFGAGGPADPALGELAAQGAAWRRRVAAEQRRVAAAISRLLGVAYPPPRPEDGKRSPNAHK